MRILCIADGVQLRQQRKADLEQHVAEVNRLLKKADPNAASASDDDADEDDSEEEWNGIEEKQEVVDHEEEYVDEDKYTTVTVETVDIDRDGFRKRKEIGEEDESDEAEEDAPVDKVGSTEEKQAHGKRVWTKEKPKTDKRKKKKKKFRYESKADRKATRDKQKMKNREQAKARKAKGK